jgi:DNA-binding transcriptional LysR family regulator
MMLPPLEFRQLRYVVAVAEELHFTRASERLYVTQSALTRQIAQLESNLGVRLFERDTRHVELTAAGKVFVEEARRILESAHRAVALAQGTDRQDHGEVHIAYSPLVDLQVAGDLRKALAVSDPTLQPKFSGRSIELQTAGILDGTYLAGLTVLPATDTALSAQVFLTQRLMAVLPAGHKMARKRQLELRELASDAIVWFPRELHPGFHEHFAEWCRAAGYHPTVVQEAAGLTERFHFVADGVGISFTAESARPVQFPGVVLRPITRPPLAIETGLVYRSDSKSVVLKQVLESAMRHFATVGSPVGPAASKNGPRVVGAEMDD